jgi:isoleucyl-tRNA synthetase
VNTWCSAAAIRRGVPRTWSTRLAPRCRSQGNVIDPWIVLDSPAPTLRWYSSRPARRGRLRVPRGHRRSHATSYSLWNTYSFFVTCANLDGWSTGPMPRRRGRHVLDRWIDRGSTARSAGHRRTRVLRRLRAHA